MQHYFAHWRENLKDKVAQLIERTLHGDKDAFCVLVSEYQNAVYGLAFHYLRNFADAQDVAQDVFLEAYRRLGTLQHPEKFASWLYSITANLCKMWLRRQRETVSIDEITQKEAYNLFKNAQMQTPDYVCEQQELHEQVMEAIAQLPEPNRIVVTLCYIDGLSYKEISDFLDVPTGTVKSRLHRAKQILKKELVDMVAQDFKEHKLDQSFTDKIRRQVLASVTEILAELSPKYGFSQAYILGSTVAEGKFQPKSDVDIALVNLSNQHFFSLMSEMSRRLERNVHLHQIEKMDESLRSKVEEHGVLWKRD
jgi:RNA polymerase sigma-70 factor (ECF subfamily)